jgi:hypothetical protein
LVVLVVVTRVEEVGSSGRISFSEKVSWLEKVVLVLLAVEAGAVKEGSRFLASRRVLGRAITVCAIKASAVKAGSGSCHQGGCS